MNAPLPKFKDHLSNFSIDGTITTNEYLISFSEADHNIGENDNYTCMRLFFNSFASKAVANLFEFHSKAFSTWDELCYWFKSTYGEPQSLIDLLCDYNNVSFPQGDNIMKFNLHFTKIYNQILEIIHSQNQDDMMHYYSVLPPPYC